MLPSPRPCSPQRRPFCSPPALILHMSPSPTYSRATSHQGSTTSPRGTTSISLPVSPRIHNNLVRQMPFFLSYTKYFSNPKQEFMNRQLFSNPNFHSITDIL